MALFKRTKKETDVAVTKAGGMPVPGVSSSVSLADILRNPRITEKATFLQGGSAYVFDVAPYATKTQIAEAVKRFYNVVPRAVNVMPIPTKTVRNMKTGKHGVKRGGRKAYVFLKKGDTITIS